MLRSWRVAAVMMVGGLSAAPASAFHPHSCGSGTTTVSVPTTVTRTTTRTSFASVPVASAGIASFGALTTVPTVTSFNVVPTVASFGAVTTVPTVTAANAFSGLTALNVVPMGTNFGTNFGTNATCGDLGTLNQSIQDLNATMRQTNANLQQTNRLLARLVGDARIPPATDDNPDNVPIPPIPGDILSPGLTTTTPPRQPYLPYHLYAERQIDAAIAARDGARVEYYVRRNTEHTARLQKELTDTQARITEKVNQAKAAKLIP